jgi:hypothetical protein
MLCKQFDRLYDLVGDQIAHGGWDVIVRMGSRGGGLDMAEAVEGVGGGGVERVSILTSNPFIAGSVFR